MEDGATRAAAGPARRVALLVLLGAAAGLAYADRVAFSIAADAIGRALGLSDAALGALGGLAFALLYAAAALPLGRLGDRGGARVELIAGSVVCWSLATFASGRAHGFDALFAARVGVGLGEAGLTPNAMPLVARSFAPARHPLAFACYWSLAYAGLVLGLWGGGVLVDRFGWRIMFACAALPGPPLALAILLVGRGSGRAATAREAGAGSRRLAADLAALRRVPGFGHALAFGASSGLVAWGGLAWDAPFYMRRFGLDAGQAGFWFGTAFGIATVLGTAAGGPLGAAFGAGGGGASRALRASAWLCLAGQPFQLAAYLAPSLPWSLAAMTVATVTGAAMIGPLWSSMQAALPPPLRATGTVAYGFAASVVGAGLGPPLFGALSDALAPRLGAASLEGSLAVAAVVGAWPALHLFGLARANSAARPD